MKWLRIICLAVLPTTLWAADLISYVDAPKTVLPGQEVDVSITYETDTALARDILVILQPGNKIYRRFNALAGGPHTEMFRVNVNSSADLGDNCRWMIRIVADRGRYKDVVADPYVVDGVRCVSSIGYTDAIRSVSGGKTPISPTDLTSVSVSYEAAGERDVLVRLVSESDWSVQASERMYVSEGSGRVVSMLSFSDIPVGNYRYTAHLLPRGGAFDDRAPNAMQANVVCEGAVTAEDAIYSISGANEVIQGGLYEITVDYETSEERDILVYCKLSAVPDANYCWHVFNASAIGARTTQTLYVPMYENQPPLADTAYTFYVRLIDDGGGWGDMHDHATITGVSSITTSGRDIYTSRPIEYPYALINALKGMRPSNPDPENVYNTLRLDHINWNYLEQNESDTVEQIIERCNVRWSVYKKGLRFIPHPCSISWFNNNEVVLPNGLTLYDYENNTPEFERRLRKFIAKLGKAWDNDPRVAWVNLGMYGIGGSHDNVWGHNYPRITPAQQEILRSAYNEAFKNKKLMMNFSQDFPSDEYGVYNRSWAHYLELDQLRDIEDLNRRTGRWKVAPLTGQVSYYHSTSSIHPGVSADDTLSTPKHLEFLLDTIRRAHCNALGSVCDYTESSSFVGANDVQKALGYRFVISKASWTARVNSGETLDFSFTVKNTGSAPFYYDWPVYLYLLNPDTKVIEAQVELSDIDIRDWMAGDDWDNEYNYYQVPALDYVETASINIPEGLANNEYIIALAIIDPLSDTPAVRFAINNQFGAGLHPLGYVGIGQDVSAGYEIDPETFTDPWAEGPLAY